MKKLLRRIRGAIGMGLTWAVVWAVAGGVPRWVFGVETDLPLSIVFGGFGFVSGVIFSGILVLTEGRRRFDQMSLPRFATWGGIGGFLISVLFVRGTSASWAEVLMWNVIFSTVCAVCATGSLALARSAAKDQLSNSPLPKSQLSASGGELSTAELTDDEQRELLRR